VQEILSVFKLLQRKKQDKLAISTSVAKKSGHRFFGSATWLPCALAQALAETVILDRIVHNACRLKLDGQSMRKTRAKTVDETPVN